MAEHAPTILSDLLHAQPLQDCWRYKEPIRKWVESGASSDEEREQGLLLLHSVSLVLRPEERSALIPTIPGVAKAVDDFAEDEIGRLLGSLDDWPLPVQARVRDLAWCRCRNVPAAEAAVQDYVALGKAFAVEPKLGIQSLSMLRRALAIAARMGKKELHAEVIDAIEEVALSEGTQAGATVAAARLLLDGKLGDAGALAVRLKTVVESLPTPGDEAIDWDWRRFAWETLAEAHRHLGQEPAERDARVQRAETFSEQSSWLEGRGANALVRADLLRRGIAALRQLSETGERVKEIARELREVQAQTMDELKRIDGPSMDLTDAAHDAIDAVSGLDFRSALLKLVTLFAPQPVDVLRRNAIQGAQQSPLQFLMPRSILDAEGRVVRKHAGGSLDAGSQQEEAIQDAMAENLVFWRACMTKGLIDPARRQIATEHAATAQQWWRVVGDSPVVDPRRARTWITGLDAGLRGDFATATSLLVPQIEHLLRIFAESRGRQAEWIDDDGVHRYKLLNALLEMDEVKQVLGEDLHFDIVRLLGREGQNFRNLLAHGLFSDAAFNSVDAVYLWHLALRLLLLPLVGNDDAAAADDGDEHAAIEEPGEPKDPDAEGAEASTDQDEGDQDEPDADGHDAAQ